MLLRFPARVRCILFFSLSCPEGALEVESLHDGGHLKSAEQSVGSSPALEISERCRDISLKLAYSVRWTVDSASLSRCLPCWDPCISSKSVDPICSSQWRAAKTLLTT